MDRSALSQALAKIIAYQACGKLDMANEWAAKLTAMLKAGGVNA